MNEKELLLNLLADFPDSEKIVQTLLARFSTIERIFSAPSDELIFVVPENVAAYLKLLPAIIKRQTTDKFKFPKKYTEPEIRDYLSALFLFEGEESAYALFFDAQGRLTSCERLSQGSLNYAAVSARKLTELAVRKGASSVILAHNHPFGVAAFSEEDVQGTELLSAALKEINVRLISHAVFAGGEYSVIKPKTEG